MTLANERIVYLNGDYVPESSGLIHFRDRGFVYGDAAFDTARTFNGKIYRLDEHIERLYRSLKYLRIDPGVNADAMAAITQEVVDRNLHLLGPDEDYWVTQRVTRGANFPDGPGARSGATVVVECVPLPLKKRAVLYRDGVDIIISSVRRTPPESLSPSAKMQNYLNLIVAGFDAEGAGERAWPIVLDTRGFLAEGSGSNIFLVTGGKVRTPHAQYVLAGVSRDITVSLCERMGIACSETDLAPYDAVTADEAFITSTSLCICPVGSFNGQALANPATPGPITQRLMDGFTEEVGADFAAQYLRHLPADAAKAIA